MSTPRGYCTCSLIAISYFFYNLFLFCSSYSYCTHHCVDTHRPTVVDLLVHSSWQMLIRLALRTRKGHLRFWHSSMPKKSLDRAASMSWVAKCLVPDFPVTSIIDKYPRALFVASRIVPTPSPSNIHKSDRFGRD